MVLVFSTENKLFVDLEKAFDRISRKAIEWALRKQLVPEHSAKELLMLFEDTCSKLRAAGEGSRGFPINAGVGTSGLSPKPSTFHTDHGAGNERVHRRSVMADAIRR